VRLLFKFKENVPADEQERVLTSLRTNGARDVERLFPDALETDLASLFVLDPGPDDGATRFLSLLEEEPVVEYAEPEVQRKLVS
jgi:hypothetical protein